MLKKYQSNLTLTLLFTILIIYLLNSTIIINEFINYTNIFITKLFPTTFIIYIFANILINYQIINKLETLFQSKASIIYIIIMSMISGFPSGPKYIKNLLNKNYIDLKTANYLIYFTHFPNPLFILGTVQNIINNKETTYIILISIILSNLLISITLPFPEQSIKTLPKFQTKSFSNILSQAIMDSLKISILIYGTSIFFYLISILITNYLNLPIYLYIPIMAFFDLTKGITLASLIKNKLIQAIFIIIITTLSTLSIHIQTKSILTDTNIKYKNFIIGRIISTILSVIIFLIIRSLLDIQ